MSVEEYLLDTSALFTLIEDEAGAEKVEDVLRNNRVWLPWVVLMETYYITQQERDEVEADHRYAIVKQLPATILWDLDEPTLLAAARIKATRRLSLADSLIAAFAIQKKATLLHKDPEFEALAELAVLEALPYK